MPDKHIKRLILWCAAIPLFLAAVFLGFKYMLPVIGPFLLAAVAAELIRPAAKKLADKTGKNERFFSLIIILLLFAALFLIFRYLGVRLIKESVSIAEMIGEIIKGSRPNPLASFTEHFISLSEKLHLSSAGSAVSEAVKGFASSALTSLGQFTASATAKIFASVPGIVFSFAVFTVALFYLCLDFGGIVKSAKGLLPVSVYSLLAAFRRRANDAMFGYLRAAFIILVWTIVQLYAGFLILRVNYALLLALVVAFVDMLPVLGIGTVLIPWSIFAFCTGDIYRGVGTLVLFIVITMVRQFLEPRIMGNYIGVHPVFVLITVYGGLILFGVCGMILAPILLYIIVSFVEEKREGT